MFHLPREIVAQLVGQFDLRQRVLVKLVFVIRPPGARQLQLVEHSEFHGPVPPANFAFRDGRAKTRARQIAETPNSENARRRT